MRMILMLGALTLVLAGCAFLDSSSGYIATSPKAEAMYACANGIDFFTPGISLQALPGLVRGSAATLGDTPEEAMENCLTMLRAIPD